MNLEGILSAYGFEAIDTGIRETSWIAENEDEKQLIHLTTYRVSRRRKDGPPLPPDIMARSIMASHGAHDIEVPLAFYRKAFASYKQSRFLESCYDYFFFLECLFADSKVKKAEVQKKFRESTQLQEAIRKSIGGDFFASELAQISPSRYKELIEKSESEISDFLVDFRGEIHHYKSRHRKKWHPSRPKEAEFEATLFRNISYNIAIKLIVDEIFGERIVPEDIRCYRRARENEARGTN
jgi:hypothetical protein